MRVSSTTMRSTDRLMRSSRSAPMVLPLLPPQRVPLATLDDVAPHSVRATGLRSAVGARLTHKVQRLGCWPACI